MAAQVKIETKAERMSNPEFLHAYLKKLQRHYELSQELDYCDLQTPPAEYPARWNAEQESVARMADKYGLNGSLFRDHLTRPPDFDPLSLSAIRQLRRKIETVAQIIGKLEEPVADQAPPAIPEEAKLLKVPQVAKVLGWGESVVRERDRRGLLPKPVRIGGTIQWRRNELDAWMKADCPTREAWEKCRTQWMEETGDVTS